MYCPLCSAYVCVPDGIRGPYPATCGECGARLMIRFDPTTGVVASISATATRRPRPAIRSDATGFAESIERPEDRR